MNETIDSLFKTPQTVERVMTGTEERAKMKVLVTGATGRVGANVVKRLNTVNAEVRTIVMPGDPHAAKLNAFPGLEIVEGDLCDQRVVDRACKGVTHIVHLAAQMVRGDTPVDRFYDINSFSTLRLLEGALQYGQPLQRFVLASTDATYRPGEPPSVPLTEDVPQRPADYYGTSKLLGETILRNRCDQFELPFSIVRFGTVFSPEEAHNLYRLDFMRGWLRTQQELGRNATLWPLFDGKPNLAELLDSATPGASDDAAVALVGPEGPWTLSMVDVRDAAQGVHRALTEPGAVGRSFNIAAKRALTSVEGATAVSEIFRVPMHTVEMPMTWRLELDIEAARHHLGYEPQFDYRGTVLASTTPPAPQDEYIPASEGDTGVYAKLSGGHVVTQAN